MRLTVSASSQQLSANAARSALARAQVIIHVVARRFRCLNAVCVRKTFAERLDAAAAYARRTKRLGDLQHYLALLSAAQRGRGLRNGLLRQ